MARMIPPIDPEQIKNFAEREVYKQLREQLPGEWVVRHHYYACIKEGIRLRECEADFIVSAPRLGILFLEVKGSHGFDCVDSQWYRVKRDGCRERADNPFDQVAGTQHRIVTHFCDRVLGVGKDAFPGIFGYAVVYPFGRVVGSLPPSVPASLMFAYKDMGDLHRRLTSVYLQWGTSDRAKRYEPAIHGKIAKALEDGVRLVPVFAADMDRDARAILDLTKGQFDAFRGLLGNTRVMVRGTAGSGKTMIALWAAEAFAEQGKRVLMLCYNRCLATWFGVSNGDRMKSEVRSFFAFCRGLALKHGVPFDPPPEEDHASQDFWARTAPTLFCEAIDRMPDDEKYDVVIVDEAQDFHQDWWLPVEMLLRDSGRDRLFVFFDPEQTGIYGRGEAFPAHISATYELRRNCRNTRRIASYCGSVIGKEIIAFERSPDGVVPEIVRALPGMPERANEVRDRLMGFFREEVSPARMVVLSPCSPASLSSSLSLLSSVNSFRLSGREEDIGEWIKGNVIWKSTIKSFKGLEADCVVITDVPRSGSSGFSLSDLYVAASRARHRLVVIPVCSDAETELRAWAKRVS